MKSYTSKYNFFISFLLIATLNFALLTFNLKTVTAQTAIPFTVAPARHELSVSPGEEININIRFYNIGDTSIPGILKASDFIVDNQQGTPRIIEDVSMSSPRFSAASWITMPYDRMAVAAQNKVSVPVSIKVPHDARPGGRYVAVYFEPTAGNYRTTENDEEVATSIAPRIASLIYIRVKGDAFEKAIISRFFATYFQEYGPIKLQTEILNRGDFHIRPKGVITVIDMFGGLVDQASIKEHNIFPEVSRSYENTLGKKWMFGRYKIDIAAAYGDRGQALTRFIYVWIFPWKLALVIILSIIILIILFSQIYKKFILREIRLEEELHKEKEEIEKLKRELKDRD